LEVKIHDNAALTSMDFSDLVTVGEFTIERNYSLSSLNIDQLQYSTGINIYYSNLVSVNIPQIESIIQNLNIAENPALISITVNNLKYVGMGFAIYNNPVLSSISFSSLDRIRNIFAGQQNPLLSTIDIGNISVPCDIDFQRCALSSETINAILAQMVSISPPVSGTYIRLQGQNPPAPPTGQGITDRDTLIANGNTVETD